MSTQATKLKFVVNDISEIWSVDLAYVNKHAEYNHGVKYLLCLWLLTDWECVLGLSH